MPDLKVSKFQYRSVCDVRGCKDRAEHSNGAIGERGANHNFCGFHQKQIAEQTIQIYKDDVEFIDSIFNILKVEPTKTEKTISDLFHTNPPINETPEAKPQQNIESLLNEIEELKTKLAVVPTEPKESQDVEQLKSELLSVKAANELFKENIDTLTIENNKLKQANKKSQPTKKKR